MSGSVNSVTLIGNLGRDPEVRTAASGQKVVNLSIATTDSWNDKISGQRKERTEWHKVVILNENVAGIAERYLRKGSKCYINGQLQTRKWQDQSGQDRYSTEVIIGARRGELTLLDSAPNASQQPQQEAYNRDQLSKRKNTSPGFGDEVPF